MASGTMQRMRKGPSRSEIAGRLLDRLVPEAKRLGSQTLISPAIPAPWALEKYGIRILLTENVLLLPHDPALSTMLDIWWPPLGKVFSAHWRPIQPEVVPTLTCLKRGPWLTTILGDLDSD